MHLLRIFVQAARHAAAVRLAGPNSAQREMPVTLCGCVGSHMRVHSGEKPYKCDVCAREFAEKGTLTK